MPTRAVVKACLGNRAVLGLEGLEIAESQAHNLGAFEISHVQNPGHACA